MTLRSRLMLSFTGLVVIPLVVVGLGIRQNVTGRLTRQFQSRVSALASFIRLELTNESRNIGERLDAISREIAGDNPFRAAAQGAVSERSYLLDYASTAMRISGLQMLQIQDENGRIISSGHFRNEYDRLEPELPTALASVPEGTALASARSAVGPFLALVKVDSVMLGARWLHLVGGRSVERTFLERLAGDSALAVSLLYPGGVLSSDAELERRLRVPAPEGAEEYGLDTAVVFSDYITTRIDLPYVNPQNHDQISSASVIVTHPLRQLNELRRGIDLWFAAALVVTAVAALAVATWLSTLLSRPLSDLARKTSEIDLDRLDIAFDSSRTDEVGMLSRLLGTMTGRLRKSAARLKEVERRAAVGELARQVNHDIKNGLIPIRNVLRHLQEVADEDPGRLRSVLSERQVTLNSSVSYLENLAANYARLYPRTEHRPCDVNDVIRSVGRNLKLTDEIELRIELETGIAPVLGDPVAIRRILENLVGNAIDAIGSGSGTVAIAAAAAEGRVKVVVADTGPGMAERQLERIFEDFYTTKPDGTGLGLSIVRRLVLDMSGTLRVESEPGVGTTFTVELPIAASGG
jgi:signal transduction histidine kinase